MVRPMSEPVINTAAAYTPTTDQVEVAFVYVGGVTGTFEERRASFRSWLASHDAEARAEGARAERERIARAIEVEMRKHDREQVGFSAIGDAYAHAARIARKADIVDEEDDRG